MVQQFSVNRIIGKSILGLCKGILPESGEKGEILALCQMVVLIRLCMSHDEWLYNGLIGPKFCSVCHLFWPISSCSIMSVKTSDS
jgi:hypothetical protein